MEVRAEANDTWMFSSWEGDISRSENPIVVTVESDMVFTALFEKLQYPLDINVEGGGTAEENIVESKMTDYEIGTGVELNAVADDGWVFDAFDSLLRLHAAGALDDNAALQYSGSAGIYWSSNQENSDKASFLSISSSGSNIGADGDKSAALTVRCIKN